MEISSIKFLSYRSAFMGIAMMAVVLYHYQVWYNEFSVRLIKFLVGRGYVGVDIFLFFSAVGLSFSLKKNGWKIFYKHRVLRILPLYLLLASYRIVSNVVFGFISLFSARSDVLILLFTSL